jgi:hypothetical protein
MNGGVVRGNLIDFKDIHVYNENAQRRRRKRRICIV